MVAKESRDRGYFEVTVGSDVTGLTIGLAIADVDREFPLGYGKGGLGWMSGPYNSVCLMHTSLCIVSPEILPANRFFDENTRAVFDHLSPCATYATQCARGEDYTPQNTKAVFAPPFQRNDVIGMLVTCISDPMLIFFVNGVRQHQMDLEEEVHGKVLFPAFYAGWREHIKFSSNPNFPASHARVCLPDCQIFHLSVPLLYSWFFDHDNGEADDDDEKEVGVVVAKSCGPKVKRRRGAVVAKPNK